MVANFLFYFLGAYKFHSPVRSTVDQRENIRVIYGWLKGENIRLTDAHSKGAFYTVPFWINVSSVSGKKVVNTYAPVYNFDADCVTVPKLCQRLRLVRSIFAFTIHLRNFQHISTVGMEKQAESVFHKFDVNGCLRDRPLVMLRIRHTLFSSV
jgi:hypothetical protein